MALAFSSCQQTEAPIKTAETTQQSATNDYKLTPLPFATDALEPKISSKTFDYHWGKHLAAYVRNFNLLKQGTKFDTLPLSAAIKEAEGGLYNNAAQIFNHEFYFEQMTDSLGTLPSASLTSAIDEQFGSFDKFRNDFTATARTLFGSGWVWLVADDKNQLSIIALSDAGNPLRDDLHPLMVIDVWEHAYYLDYQNRRPQYIDTFWDVMNWDIINERFSSLTL